MNNDITLNDMVKLHKKAVDAMGYVARLEHDLRIMLEARGLSYKDLRLVHTNPATQAVLGEPS
jgi:hypothetical protein